MIKRGTFTMNLTNNLKVKSVWLPSEYFETDDKDILKVINNTEYILCDSTEVSQYSFETNRIKYDSDWYNDFYLELE